ncbi:hypothetical protein LTSEURB_5655, partial [Salmonella enterica subsp. enterica serovar Urbana str. R8-2977]
MHLSFLNIKNIRSQSFAFITWSDKITAFPPQTQNSE